VVEQLTRQRLLTVLIAANGEGHFDVRPQFDQTDLADLRKGGKAPALRPPEARWNAAALAALSGTSRTGC